MDTVSKFTKTIDKKENQPSLINIDLSKFKNGEIKLELIDKNCKGVGVEVYWN